MNKVIVATDSVACLPWQVVREYSVYVIPSQISVEGRVYCDADDDLPPKLC